MRALVLLRRLHLARFAAAAVTIMLSLATSGDVLATSTGPLSLGPDPADFGTVAIDSTQRITITATNTRPTPLLVTGVRAPATPFRIDSNECSGKLLASGGTCRVTVAFTPRASGLFSATLQIETGVDVSTSTLKGDASVPIPTTTRPPGPTTTTMARTTTSRGPTSTGSTTLPSTSSPTTVPGATTTTALGTTVPPTPDDQRLQECERQARDAKVSYAPRQKMEIDETQQVQVTASIGDATATTLTSTTGGVTTTVVPVTLRCEVQAQLRGGDFKVTPDGFQGASFLDRPIVTWSWDVVPLKAGTGVLTLEIRSVAQIEGRRIEGAGGELFTTSIDVGVKPENPGQTVTRWSKAVVEHPLVQGFGSLAAIAAGLAAGWHWLLKRPWPWTKRSPEQQVAGGGPDDERNVRP